MRHSRRGLRPAAACCCVIVASTLVLNAQADRPPFRVFEASIDDVQTALRSHQISCHDLVGQYLTRIDAFNRRGPSINAVETINPHALDDADRLDRVEATAGRGPLHCVPILVKDELDTGGLETTYGSAAFKGFFPSADATVIARLKAAGAIIIGKATMGEFASGYATSVSGVIRDPYDLTRHASGSSGGTGAGIAANLATVGIGEDTGGSVRGPAATGSLVGLRPSLPFVSRAGLLPARPTTDTVGPIARTVKDAAIIMDVIAGYDPRDPVTAEAPTLVPGTFVSRLNAQSLRGARLGVIRQSQDARTDSQSAEFVAFHRVGDVALQRLQTLGAVTVELAEIPNLAKRLDQDYDGNVFETEQAVDRFLAAETRPPFNTLREVLLSGLMLPARAATLIDSVNRTTADVGYHRIRQDVRDLTEHLLGVIKQQRLDAVVYLTADIPPIHLEPDVMTNPRAGGTRLGSNRRLASVLSFPAITVPAGFTPEGLPVGLEFLGVPFSDATLLSLAYAFESGTHHRRPPASTPALEFISR